MNVNETEDKKIGKNRRAYLIAAGAIVLLLGTYELFFGGWLEKILLGSPRVLTALSEREIGLISGSADAVISRLFGLCAACCTVKYLGYRTLGKCGGRGFLCALPCFLVALCNPPILALIFGSSSLDYAGGKMAAYMAMFAAECIAVAAFEEILFRGAVFLAVLETRRNDGKQIFVSAAVSSAIFAAAHLLNIFTSDPVAVALQAGYSFLLGGMCAYVLLCTKNIGFCIALHAIFNFCGTLTEKFGRGTWATAPIIAFTCVLGVIVAAIVIRGLFKMKKENTDVFFICLQSGERAAQD